MSPSFGEFFREVWGYDPFPWQARLSEQVASSGWPAVIDLPTGTGKTAALDVALHHLALDGGRQAPRRLVLVVDRRVVVDQVGRRARTLRAALESPRGQATRAIAEALRRMVGEGFPLLETAVLRGATPRDDAWARHPHVPVLAASTVDQVGSRLLFRGYGVSDGMRPIHAGLLGCDTLLLLDEVHLARPFAEMLAQLDALRGEEGEIPRRFRVSRLSATPGTSDENVFGLDDADRGHPILARRLEATKPSELKTVKVRARAAEDDKRAAIASAAATEARSMLAEGRRAVAVVVNRVDTARRVWRELEDATFDRALLTGRMRPLDQSDQLAAIEDRVVAGRTDREDGRPLVVVATQCIEAGADFDFDGMVTECASLDALRQRFGRLDRLGGRPSRAIVLIRSDQTGETDDPVYGTALGLTWRWLEESGEAGTIDFGIASLEPMLRALGPDVMALNAPRRDAPVVMPAYLDQWVQTAPRPAADPDVGLFLHGIVDAARPLVPDVVVVWRADVTDADLERAHEDPAALERLTDLVGAVPPGRLEAVSLPPWAVIRWLLESPATDDPDIADVDGTTGQGVDEEQQAERLVLVWRGRRDTTVVPVRRVEPGATIVVPARWGGIGPHGTFEPREPDVDSPVPVTDLGDAVQLLQRGRPTLRLDPGVVDPHLVNEAASGFRLDDEDHDLDPRIGAREHLEDFLERAPRAGTASMNRMLTVFAETAESSRPRLIQVEGTGGRSHWIALGPPLSPSRLRALLEETRSETAAPGEGTTEGDEGSFLGARVSLDEHLRGVADHASAFGEGAGLPPPLVAAVRWAGLIHDAGKVDTRFQLWLLAGDEVAAASGTPLAKSPLPRQDAAARRRARALSGYQRGQRHELVSLDMAEGSPDLRERVAADGADWDLVLHLVASHHGWCRPFAPAFALEEDLGEPVALEIDGLALTGTTAHGRARLDRGVSDRFWRLVRRYGWHELSYLEAILRLADHRRSEAEQTGVPG